MYILCIGLPWWKNASVLYQCHQTYVTALLQLGDMFDSGGVPIDHYIIAMDNGTWFETTSNTYGLNMPHNTTLAVNVSAHNCVGYSDPIQLELVKGLQHTSNLK